jgi:hypothetical protein
MKKSILNIGKVLNKVEQKQINGGNSIACNADPINLGPDGCPCGCYYDIETSSCVILFPKTKKSSDC